MKKITYIISDLDYSKHFLWIAKYFQNTSYTLSFVFLNASKPRLFDELCHLSEEIYWIRHHGKKSLIPNLFRLYLYLKKAPPDIIHTHLWDASWLGLICGKLLNVKKRVYTRHHGAIHHMYFKRAVFYDKLLNRLATDIIVLSTTHLELLRDKENVHEKKLQLIPHGFDLKEFSGVSTERVGQIRKKYSIPSQKLIIGTISRYTHWKGVQYIIPAVRSLLKEFELHWVLANAKGDYKKEIQEALSSLPDKAYTEIEFEEDIAALYKSFDILVHVPISEAAESFGQVYIEGLLNKLPSVFTESGILRDIQDKSGLKIVPYCDSQAIQIELKSLLINQERPQKVDLEEFTVEKMGFRLKKLYDN
ncbi:MAG: glycosyltransferase family 4 protein [Bacteroidota bacterium]